VKEKFNHEPIERHEKKKWLRIPESAGLAIDIAAT
jgi:hypothetical protein